MKTDVQAILELLETLPASLHTIAAEIEALQERIAELEQTPRAVGTIWERPSEAKGRKNDPQYTVYYITHHKHSPYWDDNVDKDRRERIGVGMEAKADAEQRFADEREYRDAKRQLFDLEMKLSRAKREIETISKSLDPSSASNRLICTLAYS